MDNVKDDPRENDWAEKRIGELEERLKRLEGQTSFETSEDDARVRHLENQWSRTVTEVKAAIRSLSDQGNADRDRLNQLIGLSARVTGIMERLDFLEERMAGMTPYTELEFRVSALEGHPRRVKTYPGGIEVTAPEGMYFEERSPDDDFSPPIGAMHTGLFDEMDRRKRKRRDADEADGGVVRRFIAEGPFKAGDMIPGWLMKVSVMNEIRDRLIEIEKVPIAERTREIALKAAAQRIRGYMNGHFSEATIQGVLAAALGDTMKPEDNLALDAKLPTRSPLSPCPGEMKCWAAENGYGHWHDALGVVHKIDA